MPGDKVRFHRVDQTWAAEMEAAAARAIETLTPPPLPPAVRDQAKVLLRPRGSAQISGSPILHRLRGGDARPEVTYRQSGDKYILVEYGALVLDLNLRFRVHALMTWLQKLRRRGIVDLTPGIRSLQIHFDDRLLPLRRLLDVLIDAEEKLPAIEDMRFHRSNTKKNGDGRCEYSPFLPP